MKTFKTIILAALLLLTAAASASCSKDEGGPSKQELSAQIDSLTRAQAALGVKIASLEGDVTDIKTQYAALSEEIAKLKADYSATKEAVATIAAQQATLTAAVDALLLRIQYIRPASDYDDYSMDIPQDTVLVRFDVRPLSAAQALCERWSAGSGTLTLEMATLRTRAGDDDALKPEILDVRVENSQLCVKIDGLKLPQEFHIGVPYWARLVVDDGNNDLVTDAFPVYPALDVDLGLSVIWASRNVGAKRPKDYGDYIAWGEVEPYYDEGLSRSVICHSWRQMVSRNGYEARYGKYDWEGYTGIFETKEWSTSVEWRHLPYDVSTHVLEPYYDAARQSLGKPWRTPTKEECEELVDTVNATKWTYNKKYNCILVTSRNVKYSGRFLVIACGSMWADSGLNWQQDDAAFYWSATRGKDIDHGTAYVMAAFPTTEDFPLYVSDVTGFYRCEGYHIRGVRSREE